jgi:hypothetical protein
MMCSVPVTNVNIMREISADGIVSYSDVLINV